MDMIYDLKRLWLVAKQGNIELFIVFLRLARVKE